MESEADARAVSTRTRKGHGECVGRERFPLIREHKLSSHPHLEKEDCLLNEACCRQVRSGSGLLVVVRRRILGSQELGVILQYTQVRREKLAPGF